MRRHRRGEGCAHERDDMNAKIMSAMLIAAMALGACDRPGANEKAPPKTTAAAKPAPKKNVNAPVEDAMMAIPPQMRNDYQSAFACEVKRNKAKGEAKAINVTPDYVRGLTARLKADASLAKC